MPTRQRKHINTDKFDTFVHPVGFAIEITYELVAVVFIEYIYNIYIYIYMHIRLNEVIHD